MKKKLMVAAVLSSVVVGAVSAAAYSGSYSFDIGYEVKGTNVHSLENIATSTTAKADSFNYDGTRSTSKDNYSVQLYKNFYTYYTVSNLLADDSSQTKNFGKIDKGNYTINVSKNGGSAAKIIGVGTINQ
ncbi:hypothetical protein ACFFSY_07660 [Paenibacillus aurantiacus]|uniref:NEAT domain-containing protein n=1 Tax=Paenibacillus aurantiacus TaxID=1936118 RepID=A0ABV5KKP6_9BACL